MDYFYAASSLTRTSSGLVVKYPTDAACTIRVSVTVPHDEFGVYCTKIDITLASYHVVIKNPKLQTIW